MNNQEDLQRIKALRLIDDEFMSVCFDNYIEGAELLLKVILDREDLKVSEVRTQRRSRIFRAGMYGLIFMLLIKMELNTILRSSVPIQALIRKEPDIIRVWLMLIC